MKRVPIPFPWGDLVMALATLAAALIQYTAARKR